MTAAQQVALDRLTAQQDAEQLAAEQAASLQASKQLRAELLAITAAVLLLRDGSDDRGRQIIAALAARLQQLAFDPAPVLTRHAQTALELGVQHAVEQFEVGAGKTPSDPLDLNYLSDPVRAVIAGAEFRARGHLTMAAELLTIATDQAGLLAAMGKARQAVTEIERAASFAVTRSAADAVEAMAAANGAARLWVGERDACLHCLAYVGHIADAGHPFPAGLTFARKPLSGALSGPVENPPLHPHCRCRIIVWRRSWADGADTSYPAALKREAKRSVLRGWSLESESEASRVDAARRLLERANGMPASVQDYGRRAVERGSFPRGRVLP